MSDDDNNNNDDMTMMTMLSDCAAIMKKSTKIVPAIVKQTTTTKKKKNCGMTPGLRELTSTQLKILWGKVQRNSKGREWFAQDNGQPEDTPVTEHCWYSALPLDSNGYPKGLKLDSNPQKEWSPAQVSLALDGRFPVLGEEAVSEASHLCNHSFCINPDHLCWESRAQNMNRKNCCTWMTCPYDSCGRSFNPCKHVPQCVSFPNCQCKKHKTKFVPSQEYPSPPSINEDSISEEEEEEKKEHDDNNNNNDIKRRWNNGCHFDDDDDFVIK